MRGIVKFFNKEKKFGFICPEGDGQGDVFVHITDIECGTLIEGQHVEFETEEGSRGPKAKNVKVVPTD